MVDLPGFEPGLTDFKVGCITTMLQAPFSTQVVEAQVGIEPTPTNVATRVRSHFATAPHHGLGVQAPSPFLFLFAVDSTT